MDTDDDPPNPATPRFVPTLTEVVGARADTEPAPVGLPTLASELESDTGVDLPLELPAGPAAAPLPPFSLEATAATVLQRIGPDLDRQIGEAIARVLHEQMLGFHGRVQKAVAEVVREAVVKNLAQGAPGADAGKGP
ncbi:MAG: hypothetical protein QM772_00320 [Ottowia sp.]|uniref:hypothetical protein n=1 Tax=Ottowia sp. TaxID=1898956 RepID=UPI0039E66BD6